MTTGTRALDAALVTALSSAQAKAEARYRSARANVVTSLCALALAVGPFAPGARGVQWLVVGSAWLVFEAATVTFSRLGDGSILYKWLSFLDDAFQLGAVLSLVYLGGTAATPLWLFTLTKSFVWDARAPARLRMAVVATVATHVALAAELLVVGRVADAAFTLLALVAATIAHTASAHAAMRAATMGAERDVLEQDLRNAALQSNRDRIAREIHDGVGADVTALLLQLRREARKDAAHPTAAALADRAQTILDELRGVVWSLRNEHGTLAELGKLIDATCRRIAAPMPYVRTTPTADHPCAIGPRAALAALAAARTMTATASAQPDASRITIQLYLSAPDTLRIEVDPHGSLPSTATSLSIPLDAIAVVHERTADAAR